MLTRLEMMYDNDMTFHTSRIRTSNHTRHEHSP